MFEDEDGARWGDPRTCPRHPQVRTSDAYGMHDTPCGRCEYEMEAEMEAEARPEIAEIVERKDVNPNLDPWDLF